MSKSAVMVFVEDAWKWGEHEVSSYTYLGIYFACNGAWDVHSSIMEGKSVA